MSDWVAGLIDEAIASNHVDVQRAPVARQKPLKRLDEPAKGQAPVVAEEQAEPAYAMPPFWAKGG